MNPEPRERDWVLLGLWAGAVAVVFAAVIVVVAQ